MIYYIIYGIMLSCCVLLKLAEIKNINVNQVDKALYLIFAIVLTAMVAFRDNVGLDFGSYEMSYYEINNYSGDLVRKIFDIGPFEPLFNLLNVIAPSFRSLIVICAGLGVITKVVYYSRTNSRLFCLFLYYCSVYLYYDMGIIRQGISFVIVWFAFKYVKERKVKKFLFWVFVATMFHVTALLSIPIYLLSNKRYGFKVYFWGLVIGIIISYFIYWLLQLLINFGGAYIAYKLNAYMTYLYTESDLHSLGLTVIIRLAMLILLWYVLKNTARQDESIALNNFEDNTLFFNAYYVSIVETIAFSSLFVLATRGSGILYFCYIPLFANLVNNKRLSTGKKLLIFFVAIAFVTNSFFNNLQNSDGNLYIPFKTIFE